MRGLLLSGAFLAVVLAGCGKGGVVAEGKPDAAGSGTQPVREVDNPELTDATAAEVDGFVAKHKGQVVTVEFWSVDNEASKEQVAEFVSYFDHHKTFGLRSVFVCVDPPAKKAAAKAYLDEQKPMYTNLFVGDKAAAGLADKYGFAGKVPHQAVFARDGKRAWKTGEVNPHKLGAAPSGEKGKAPIDPQGKARGDEDKDSPKAGFKALLNHELDKVVK